MGLYTWLATPKQNAENHSYSVGFNCEKRMTATTQSLSRLLLIHMQLKYRPGLSINSAFL